MCTGFLNAPWADVLHACDGRWWNVYGRQAKAMASGEFWTCDPLTADEHGLHWMPSCEDPGLSLSPHKINTGGNSGYQAVGLAYLWGAAKIVLLGYDSQRTGGKGHCHGEHPPELPTDTPFAEFARRMIQLGADLRAQGVLVINASRETAITCFERAPIAVALSN